jgi:hypothetical protein
MIIDDFDILSAGIDPPETHPEPIVDPDTVLSFPVAFKSFQSISGRDAKILQPARDLQLPKFAASYHRKIGKTFCRIALGQGLRIGAPEGLDHGLIVTLCANNVKRF